MSEDKKPSPIKVPFEQRRAAATQFDRANQAMAQGGLDYAIQLFKTCCKLDPVSLAYRQALRQAEKKKYQNNLKGIPMAWAKIFFPKMKLNKLVKRDKNIEALELAEDILLLNPWDVPTQLALATAFENLGLVDLAVWVLTEARQADPKNPKVNRPLARVLERRGNFKEAIALWDLVRKHVPNDTEAEHKVKDLAASDTINRGRYEQTVAGDAPMPTALKGQADAAAAASESKREGSREMAAARRETVEESPTAERVEREAASLMTKIQATPTNANAYLHLANLYRRAEMIEKARDVLKKGLGPTGNNFDIAIELADLEIEPFRQNLAITEEKLRSQSASDELKKIRANLVKEINTRELDMHRKKSERYPTENVHRFEMAVRLLKLGQFDESIKELQTVRNDPRHQSKALYYLGFCFKNRNNWRLAQRNWEEALTQLSPGDESTRKEILFQLASGCAENNDVPRAIELGCELANLDFTYKNIGGLVENWQNRMQKK